MSNFGQFFLIKIVCRRSFNRLRLKLFSILEFESKRQNIILKSFRRNTINKKIITVHKTENDDEHFPLPKFPKNYPTLDRR